MPVYVFQKENGERCKCTLNRNLLLHITDTLDQSNDLDQTLTSKKKTTPDPRIKKVKKRLENKGSNSSRI